MSLGIQRGLSSTFSPAAHERRTTALQGADATKATDAAKETTAQATQPAAQAAPIETPKASEEAVQGARTRALGIEDQLRQRLDQGWQEAHHRKGHVRTFTGT